MTSRTQTAHDAPRLAGHAVVEQLVEYGVDTAYAVPGESYLAVLDGMYEHADEIRLVTARQEGGASMMAAAYGRATGRPAACLVTRGPGATNASIGVHVASQDASPMLLLVGQVPEHNRERRAFQEIDYAAMFGTIAKEVVEIHDPNRVPEQMSRAIAATTAGEPGPVVVVLPEDMLMTETSAPVVRTAAVSRPIPAPADVERVIAALAAAERPVIVAGRNNWNETTRTALASFAEASQIPVATALRCQDVIDNRSAAYIGTLGLNTTPGLPAVVEQADLVIFLGSRPDAQTMGDFSLLTPPRPAATIVHVYSDGNALGRVYAADIALPVSPEEFLAALPARVEPAGDRAAWLTLTADVRRNYQPLNDDDAVARDFMAVFNEVMPEDTIMTCGAGNYTAWAQRHRSFTTYPAQLATQSGSMGYGIPAGVAAAIQYPNRTVATFAGDGCFMMTGQELATAAGENADLLVVVVNNSRYGTIRAHQDREFPGRVSGTDLHNPDFAQLALAYGAQSTQVRTPEEFRTALNELGTASGLRLIEVLVP
ncbi:thiamine pyrophosphate-dependent enzyme [Brevibacterium moorei]|jgi:acetolactate synthase-1/2/3 large subunit|uniref:thiamine pyrophosphate-dependent enzyme n=1 Tax=Brevibacterium moorei TaxID=2968457 RepID=UPI00211B9E9D|nr:thiamine pyrophosphate-dependent enzyme [Brevibacterium sp. 68QC2CO]MCQ9386756.1 thiamine pyrophosphate-binding protein [Brevibacterium sp. 68QC2CO]